MRTPAISVVVLTYEYPRALDAVLRALDDQSDDDFEVVADDGSGPETAEVVERWGRAFGERLRHVRQTHQEARVARVRNLGAASARGAYLAFLDGDCVPRRHLVGALRRSSVSGWFAATYRFDLPRDLTGVVLDEQLPLQRWNAAGWARRLGRRGAGSLWWLTPRDRRRVGREREAELGPPLNNFGFVFLSRADLERVNGYDMRYVDWGGEDHDFAIRLRRSGLRCGWPGPRADLFHLWHESRKDTPLVQGDAQGHGRERPDRGGGRPARAGRRARRGSAERVAGRRVEPVERADEAKASLGQRRERGG